MDEEIVREEYERLIREIEEGKSDAVHRVMEEDEYEDEFSHNAIDKMHGVLFDMTKEYLHQKHPGEYIVYRLGCVCFICGRGKETRTYKKWRKNRILTPPFKGGIFRPYFFGGDFFKKFTKSFDDF